MNYRAPIKSNEESSLPQSPTHVEHDEVNANMNHDTKHDDDLGHVIHHDDEIKHEENVICVGSSGQNCHNDKHHENHKENSDEKGSETLPMNKPNDGYYIPENLWNWFWNQTHTKVIFKHHANILLILYLLIKVKMEFLEI